MGMVDIVWYSPINMLMKVENWVRWFWQKLFRHKSIHAVSIMQTKTICFHKVFKNRNQACKY